MRRMIDFDYILVFYFQKHHSRMSAITVHFFKWTNLRYKKSACDAVLVELSQLISRPSKQRF